MYQLSFYVPETHLEKVKVALFAAGAGHINGYDQCAWQVRREGQFRPLAGSQPFLGEIGQLEKVVEYKIRSKVSSVVMISFMVRFARGCDVVIPNFTISDRFLF